MRAHPLPFHPEDLTDAQLLSVAVGGGLTPERAEAFLLEVATLRWAARLDVVNLVKLGIPRAGARRLVAARELLDRTRRPLHPSPCVTCAADAAQLLHDRIAYQPQEHLAVICLNRRCRVLHLEIVSIGSKSLTIVDPADIYALALRHHAAMILVAHNHPSGDMEPSVQDVEVTKRLARAGEVLGIPLLDHLVIADEGWTSLAERGELRGYVATPAPLAA